MPRRKRIVVPGGWHHITHRGNHRQTIFFNEGDRAEYVSLVAHYCVKHRVRRLAYCLMPNHVHWIVIPEFEDGLSKAFGQAHQRYALGLQKRLETSGHLWQSRFFSCPLSQSHVFEAIRYIELNPVRAGLISKPQDWRWSSARAHLYGADPLRVVEVDWWVREGQKSTWGEHLSATPEPEHDNRFRKCTLAGLPFGAREFVAGVAAEAGVHPEPRPRGRPPKAASVSINSACHNFSVW